MNVTQERLEAAKAEAVRALLNPERPGDPHCPGDVVGVGIGKDRLRIYVVAKRVPNKLTPEVLVPRSFLGIPTDVVEIGRLGRKGRRTDHPVSHTPQNYPIRVTTDAPNVNSGAVGTLGIVVAVAEKPTYILGCNHILAVNGRVPSDAEIVSAEFVGSQQVIGGPSPYYVELMRNGDNPADCALAKIKNNGFLADLGKLHHSEPILPDLDMQVTKNGAATGSTEGTIVDVSADLYVDYSFGTFRLVDQVVIDSGSDKDEFAVRGDSGSLVVKQKTKEPVAMVFAASGRFAVASPLDRVLELLKEKTEQDLRLLTS